MKKIIALILFFLSTHSSVGQIIPPQEDHKFLEYPFQVQIIPLDTASGDFLHLFKGTKKHGDILYRNNANGTLDRVPLPKGLQGQHIIYSSRTKITIFFCSTRKKKTQYGYNIHTGKFMSQPETRGHDGEGPM